MTSDARPRRHPRAGLFSYWDLAGEVTRSSAPSTLQTAWPFLGLVADAGWRACWVSVVNLALGTTMTRVAGPAVDSGGSLAAEQSRGGGGKPRQCSCL